MTIEEKAKDFAGLKSDSKDVLADLFKSLAYKGYMEGANWMLEKAVTWFRNQKEEIGISWFADYEIRFRKAMEE